MIFLIYFSNTSFLIFYNFTLIDKLKLLAQSECLIRHFVGWEANGIAQ